MLAQAIGYNSEEDVIQNLKDAGCSEDTISEFVEDMRQGRMEAGKYLLDAYRNTLLDELHKAQKHIDCLDYLVWQMGKQE